MVTVPDAEVVVDAVVDLDMDGTEVDSAVLVVAVVEPAGEADAAVAEVADGRAAHRDSLAAAAFEDFAVQRDDRLPSWHRGQVEVEQVLLEVDSESEPPIEVQEGRLQGRRAGRPVGVHPEVVERYLGWASQSLADP